VNRHGIGRLSSQTHQYFLTVFVLFFYFGKFEWCIMFEQELFIKYLLIFMSRMKNGGGQETLLQVKKYILKMERKAGMELVVISS
jgi:hypothetical protein